MFAHEGSPSVKDTSDLPECSELSGGGGEAERASRMASCVMGRDIVTADCCGGEDEDEEGEGEEASPPSYLSSIATKFPIRSSWAQLVYHCLSSCSAVSILVDYWVPHLNLRTNSYDLYLFSQ